MDLVHLLRTTWTTSSWYPYYFLPLHKQGAYCNCYEHYSQLAISQLVSTPVNFSHLLFSDFSTPSHKVFAAEFRNFSSEEIELNQLVVELSSVQNEQHVFKLITLFALYEGNTLWMTSYFCCTTTSFVGRALVSSLPVFPSFNWNCFCLFSTSCVAPQVNTLLHCLSHHLEKPLVLEQINPQEKCKEPPQVNRSQQQRETPVVVSSRYISSKQITITSTKVRRPLPVAILLVGVFNSSLWLDWGLCTRWSCRMSHPGECPQ